MVASNTTYSIINIITNLMKVMRESLGRAKPRGSTQAACLTHENEQ
jgi:hypothetical protein